jgi:hypothetical protein
MEKLQNLHKFICKNKCFGIYVALWKDEKDLEYIAKYTRNLFEYCHDVNEVIHDKGITIINTINRSQILS